MKGFSAFLDMRRYKDWDHEISSWHHLSEDLFHQFSWSTECLLLHPEPLLGHVKGQQLQQHKMQSTQRKLANVLGNHQFGIDKGVSHRTPCMALQQTFSVPNSNMLFCLDSLCAWCRNLCWQGERVSSLQARRTGIINKNSQSLLRLSKSQALRMGPTLCFNKSSRWF